MAHRAIISGHKIVGLIIGLGIYILEILDAFSLPTSQSKGSPLIMAYAGL
jgi:hypothetical protein